MRELSIAFNFVFFQVSSFSGIFIDSGSHNRDRIDQKVWAIGAASASPFELARRGRRPWNGKIFIKAHLLVLSFSFRLIKFFSVFYEAIRFSSCFKSSFACALCKVH